jgi:hypothetical protein
MILRNFHTGRIAALLTVCASALVAQGTQTASATISVTDASGASLAGVSVRMTSPSLQIARTGTTDAGGRFVARLLPPGTYTIELVKEGFEKVKLTEKIGIDQNFQPRVVLPKTAVTVVEVIATASPDVDKTDVKSAVNYNMDRIDRLPSGRTMEAVALLTPGVTSGVGGRVQVRGAMTSGNLYLVDGQNVADNAYNTRGVLLIDDAIEETQIITGAISAEYGNVEGGVLNAITKSGGNTFSGLVRWDLSNPSWNATVPFQNRSAIPNTLSEVKTFTLGGPILKDRLWFFGAYYRTSSAGVGSISSNSLPGPGGAGSNYVTTVEEIRRTFKLTYSINQDHTLVASFGNSQNAQGNRNYAAGELDALVPQTNTSEYGNLAWRATWSPSFLSDIRYGYKKQVLSAGATDSTKSPFYNYDVGLFFNNGIFNSKDGGDNRNNKTFNAKGTIFFDAAGNHQLDFGIDYLKGTSRARNEQTVTGYIFGVYGMNLTNKTANGLDVWTYQSASGEATNENLGLFVNDKWVVNKNMALQLGIRFDKYEAKNEKGAKSAGANGVSPRLGLKYDLNGDSKWVFGVAAARYNGKVLDTIVNSVTNQGNPTEIDYEYIGPAGAVPYSVITNLSNYNITPSGITYYNNPALNVKLNPSMKAPNTDEYQVSAQYSYSHKTFGEGFLSLTAVTRKWNDLIDYSIGNSGKVADITGSLYYIRVWNNSPIAERKYSGLEFRATQNKGAWSMDGNVTWSKLEGNYEGEGSSQPGRGEGLENFTTQDGVSMYDRNITAPYGYLVGHVPIRARWQGAYTKESSWGRTTFGLIYSFQTGSHYSDTRSITRARLNPSLSSQFGSTATQYRDNKRGAYVFPATSFLNLSIHHDWKLFEVKNVPVHGFVKMVIGNVLNHQQIASWNTTSAAATGAYPAAVTSPWIRGAAYGLANTTSNYSSGRTITLSGGISF